MKKGKAMKKTLKNNLTCFVSAFIAGALFLFVCYHFKVFPFGTEYTVVRIDLAQQYGPMLTQLYDLIKSGKGIFYSWSAGLGYSFLGNYLNYLASPFNYIILLFSRENIVHSIGIIIMLKSMTISGSFSYYLKNNYNLNGAFNIIPSLLYAFSGWFVAYHWNIMWLDAVFCLPLAVLGLVRIIDGKKPWLYLVTLTYCMITNYYTAYMLCIFLCVYFIYYYFVRRNVKDDISQGFFKSRLFKCGIMFAGFSIVAALLAAVALVPLLAQLLQSSAIGDSAPRKIEFYFNVFLFLSQHFSGTSLVVQIGGPPELPNIWCGILAVILLPVYFSTKAISKKERICDLALLLLMFFSLNINILSFIWCGLHYPNGLADRFAFLYVFVTVTLLAKALSNISEFRNAYVLLSGFVSGLFIVILKVIYPDTVEKYTVIISLGFIFVWAVLYLVSKTKKADKSILKIVAVFILCLELTFSQLENFDFNFYREEYDTSSKEYLGVLKELEKQDDDLFFRTEATDTYNFMYPMVTGFNGITNFSSMASYAVSQNQYALGLLGNRENEITYFPQTPFYNSVFAIKYLIGAKDYYYGKWYDVILKEGDFAAYKNDYYLPLGFCVEKNADSFLSEIDTNPFFQQNLFFGALSGVGNMFNYCEHGAINCNSLTLNEKKIDESSFTEIYSADLKSGNTKGYLDFDFVLPKQDEYYIYINYKKCEDGVSIDFKNESVHLKRIIGDSVDEPATIIPLGERDENEQMTVHIPVNEKTEGKPISVYVASFNKDKFIEGYNKLSQHTLEITEFENTHFKGNVTAGEDCLLFTSIPYDRGWHITLDGNPVSEKDVIAIDDAYISVPLTKGEHTVEFDYFPQGLKAGACISAVTAAGLIVYLIINRKKKK